MMKRVCNTRFGVCAMLLAVFLLVGGVGAPVCAREDMSAGQAGDPGDGEEVASGGGANISESPRTGSVSTDTDRPSFDIMLLPVMLNGALTFQVVVLLVRNAVRQ